VNKKRRKNMPRVMKTVDQIARDKQRDVLYITFKKEAPEPEYDDDMILDGHAVFDWKDNANRKQVVSFLDKHQIPYQMCFDPQPIGGMLILAMPYEGQLYIDMPYDKTNAQCKILETYLENPDGSTKLTDVYFWLYRLESAMKNAEHDEPGFWDNM